MRTSKTFEKTYKGQAMPIDVQWDYWDRERISAYLTPITDSSSEYDVIKKRCSADGPMWVFYKRCRKKGSKIDIKMLKKFFLKSKMIDSYNLGQAKPPDPQAMVKMLEGV